MKLLICAVVLLAASPVWADQASNPETLKDSGNERSVYASGGLSLRLNAGGTSVVDVNPASLGSVDSYKVSFTPTSNWKRASRDGISGQGLSDIPAIAEPGSLSLILLGLVSVGMFYRRRGELLRKVI